MSVQCIMPVVKLAHICRVSVLHPYLMDCVQWMAEFKTIVDWVYIPKIFGVFLRQS